MSEATWNTTRPIRVETAEAFAPTAEAHSPTTPFRLVYTTRCRGVGFAQGLGSAAFLLTGLFMLSQISTTPALAVQLSTVGLLLSLAGSVVFYHAAQRLFGSIVVDEIGVSRNPSLAGFLIPWSRLSRWVVRESCLPARGLPVVRFWVDGNPLEFTLPADALDADGLRALRKALRDRAPEREAAL